MTGFCTVLAEQAPEDVGKSGPLGLLLTVVLLIAVALLVRSMTKHLKRIPSSFDPADREPAIDVPDDAAELFQEGRRPGEDLLDSLRKAPRAIEPPRPDGPPPDGNRSDSPRN
jgi:hypothetical protein